MFGGGKLECVPDELVIKTKEKLVGIVPVDVFEECRQYVGREGGREGGREEGGREGGRREGGREGGGREEGGREGGGREEGGREEGGREGGREEGGRVGGRKGYVDMENIFVFFSFFRAVRDFLSGQPLIDFVESPYYWRFLQWKTLER